MGTSPDARTVVNRTVTLWDEGTNKLVSVELHVDFATLARILGSRAYGNERGRADLLGGAIIAKVKK